MAGTNYAALKKQRNLAFAALRALGMDIIEIAEITGASWWTIYRATKPASGESP